MMGGSDRQTSTLRQRKKGVVGRLHSAQSHYRTRPRQKGGAHRQASLPGQWGLLAAVTSHGAASGLARDCGRRASTNFPRVPDVATPRGAALGLARDGGRRASARIHARARGAGCRHTTRSRYWTRPQGGRHAPTPPARCHPGSYQARCRLSQGSSSRWSCRAPPLGSTCNVEVVPRGGCGSRRSASALGPGPPRQCSSAREHRNGARGANTIAVPRRVAAHRAGIPVDHRRRIGGRSPPRQCPGP
jgi:hypothetical protein